MIRRVFKSLAEYLLFPVLRALGIRRTILLLDSGNWFGLPWNKIFRKPWARFFCYDLRTICFGDIVRGAPEVEVTIDPASYRNSHYKGFSLWELCKTGILASLETPVLPRILDSEQEQVVTFYYRKAARAIDGAAVVLEKHRPLSVVTVQGASPMARPLVEVSRDRNIHTAAVEGSFVADYFFCDDATGMIINRHRAASLDGHWLRSRSLTEHERERFRSTLRKARNNKREEHRTGTESNEADLREQLGIAPDRKIAIYIGQVMTDAAVLMDSPVFPNPADLVERLIVYFEKRPEWFLVIRLHPKEASGNSWANNPDEEWGYGTPPGVEEGPLPYRDLTYRRLMERGLPESGDHHVILKDRSISTDAIVDESSFGITLTSQAGFEMAMKYKRVVVCGDAFFAGKGFTTDVVRQTGLVPALNEAVEEPGLTEDEKYHVDLFGDHMLRRVLFRKDLKGCRERLFQRITGRK